MHPVLKSAALIILLAGKALAIPLSELKDNYQPIIDRNPFGLKPPPTPPTNNPSANVKEKPKLEFFLTGITSVGFPRIPKQAYLMTKEQNKSTNFYALSEGIEKDGIKILNIDDTGRKVRIHTDEGEMMLSFQTHGIAPPASPKPGMPGAPLPGQPGQVVPGQPLPNQPGVFPAPPTPVQAQPINTGQPGGTAYPNTGATRQIPSRRVRAGMDNTGNAGAPLPGAGGVTPQAQPEMDPAEQYVRMHLNRAAQEKQQGIPMPPLPTIGQ